MLDASKFEIVLAGLKWCLSLFIKGHHHDSSAVFLEQGGLLNE
jgi:hypothetical protein